MTAGCLLITHIKSTKTANQTKMKTKKTMMMIVIGIVNAKEMNVMNEMNEKERTHNRIIDNKQTNKCKNTLSVSQYHSLFVSEMSEMGSMK